NYYSGDHFLADLNYRFGGNFLAKLDGMYFYNAYPSPGAGESKKRRDHEWALGTGLDYNWKEWLTAGVGYRFHQRASNIGSRDYDQHVISADVCMKF
ncbi:MAG: outer membrane beta-barrel protein, partial [Candidatus Omnitrophica bacterium]|nr:outer membrane beta-barrel protein [Candidatus Omnitrophota bacterium]